MNQPWSYMNTLPEPPSHLTLHSIPLGLLSAPGPSTCIMHPTWAGDLFQSWRKSVLNIHWRNGCWSWNSIIWPPDMKNWLIGKDLNAVKDWRQEEEKGMTEDKMVGCHHQLERHEFEQASGVGNGQGSLACCCPWGQKKLEMTEQLNWTIYNLRKISESFSTYVV